MLTNKNAPASCIGMDEPLFVSEVSLHSLSEAKFANVTYEEVESSGPAVTPLGFPAPRGKKLLIHRLLLVALICASKLSVAIKWIVIRSKVMTGLCFSRSSGKWSKEHILFHNTACHDEPACTGYMLTPNKLKHTICGEIFKGVKVTKVDASEARRLSTGNDGIRSIMYEHKESLWLSTEEDVAVKVDRRLSIRRLHNEHSTVTNPENPWKEVAALQLLGDTHRHVINLLGAFVDDECLYEVLPYYSGGNLNEFMRHHPNGLSETEARRFFAQVLFGLHHIHSHGVAHHDISADNCMLDSFARRCVIIDFGMALRVPHSYIDDPSGAMDDVTDESMGTIRRLIHSHNHCGKLRYMAPEIYTKAYGFDGFEADIWSAGVILFLMVTGKQPYERPDMKDSGYYDLVNQNFYWDICKVDPLTSWGRKVSSELVDLLRIVLQPNPRKRATLSDILNHVWLGIP